MRRRRALSLAGLALSSALAGCLSTLTRDESEGDAEGEGERGRPDGSNATRGDDRPEGIYIQSFQESMSMQGESTAGDYRVALAFTVPHDFWTVTGREVELVPRTDADSLHLMAVVWDPESERVLPESGVSVQLTREGGVVTEEVLYPMLSQPMGFHYGANVVLPDDGTYDARVRVGGLSIRRTGSFRDRFGASASARLSLAFTDETREAVATRPIEQGGDPGALAPMDTGYPQSLAPPVSDLPGDLAGETERGDWAVAATVLPDPPTGIEGTGAYLAVSPRTRYNGFLLPAMGLSGTLTREGEPVFEGALDRTFDPTLGYHYGAVVPDAAAVDDLRVTATTPPQTARHEGYETAFFDLPEVETTLASR
ncbi:DUF7350 domain-containing protein [Halomarina ordinaria]|uniref:Fe2+ transport protein n=1 Tax=Halomarina ordinaria TaxID=3033939 RepID=A0ABD5UEL7_9EURY|nr:fe2+ transport protein [Halomarina sp. PSRA2]